MELETIFLGTSTSVPTKDRNHPAILVSFNNEKILIDCGEGTQRQLAKLSINPGKITRILITHWHTDHVAGLAPLLDTLSTSEYSKTLQIYGPRGTKQKMRNLESLYGKIKIKNQIHEASGKFLDEDSFQIQASPMEHGTPTNAYSITLKDKRRINKAKLKKLKLPNSPILKRLQEGKDITHNKKKIKAKDLTYIEPGKKITVIMDTKFTEKAVTLAKNSDLVISESSFLEKDSERAKEYKHLTAKQAATIAKKSKSKKLALIHISRRYQGAIKWIKEEAQKTFKETIVPKDLDKIKI